MIYRILKILVKLTMFFFFRKRINLNISNIPKSGPTILVANHPVTFLDPLLVAAATRRPVHFLAKGAIFKNKLTRAIFKAFNMIPIYRAQDSLRDMSKNQDTFKYCYEHLEQGGLILIFPEGVSVTDRTIKSLKTGAARIALGAEQRNDFKLGVKIVPIGLTYEAPHQFRKDVLVNVGKPVLATDFKTDHEENEKRAVREMTEEIRIRLTDLVLNVEEEENAVLVDFLIQENALAGMPFTENVESVKRLIDEIVSQDEMKKKKILNRMAELQHAQETHGLKDIVLEKRRSLLRETLFTVLKLIVGAPIIIVGLAHNALPYFLSPRLAKMISKEYEYQGPITMTAGMVICLILYPLFFYLMYTFSGHLFYSLFYLISLPILGIAAYGFFKLFNGLKIQWRMLFLFYQSKEQIAELILSKKRILQELKAIRQ